MKILSKKALAGILAGTFILAGASAPFLVNAAEYNDRDSSPAYRQCQHQKPTPEQMAQRLSEDLGVSQDSILQYQAKGMNFRDISRVAFLANASGKSMDEVISYKTTDNTWRDVAEKLDITKEQIKAARQSITAARLNAKLGMDKEAVLDLLQQGYHPRDIAMANELAQNTGSSINDVLNEKKINNTWRDVAGNLGVDSDTFKQDLQDVRPAFPHHWGGHFHMLHPDDK
ncbi:MAG: hypothetical protein ABFC57_18745 [Veillonellales bacterium]